ncbi:hypothetical protein DB41_IJ00120 [Neochlamydia sp. TUME1]|nr:hypothetical protein DB41_IJ00120 [Neochlamydia sp. TUME1]
MIKRSIKCFMIFLLPLLLLLFILIIVWSIKNGIGPMPTSPPVKQILLDNLPLQEKGLIYELGAGWGTLAFLLAHKYPQCTILAYESSPIPYFFCRIRHFFSRSPHLHLQYHDFFKANLTDAKMIICYLYPVAMQKLKKKFEEELPKGAWVVTHTFAVPSWKAEQIIEVPDLYSTKIYIYRYT